MTELLAVEDLAVAYRIGETSIHAVDGVGLTLEAGTMLGLVGESGCGKTTLARALMGVLPGNARITRGTRPARRQGPRRPASGRAPGAAVARALLRAADGDERARPGLPAARPDARGAVRARRAFPTATPIGAPPNCSAPSASIRSGSGTIRISSRAACASAPRSRSRSRSSPKLVIADEPVTALDVIVQRQVLDTIRGPRASSSASRPSSSRMTSASSPISAR